MSKLTDYYRFASNLYDDKRSRKAAYEELIDFLKKDHELNLKEAQEKCLYATIVSQKHIFATLPTGYGKSMIFKGPIISEKIRNKNCIMILIVPTVALLEDHKTSLKKFQVNTLDLQDYSKLGPDNIEKTIKIIKDRAQPTCVLSYPETIISSTGKCFFKQVSDQIKYFVIDEVHLLQFWGDLTGGRDKAFRESFTEMRKLFIHFQVKPIVINLTATLTTENVTLIMKHLGIKKDDTFKIHETPIGDKIHITVFPKHVSFSLATVANFVKNLKDDDNSRIVIFCRRIEDCGKVYVNLKSLLDEKMHGLTEIYTAQTGELKKTEIIADLQRTVGGGGKGVIRVIIATSSLSMGVNIRGAKYVIQLGLPSSFEEFLQKNGRCGREKSTGYSITYPWYVKPHINANKPFKDLMKGSLDQCLLQSIASFFPGKTESKCTSCSVCTTADSELVGLLQRYGKEEKADIKNMTCVVRGVSKLATREFKNELRRLSGKFYKNNFLNMPIGYTPLNRDVIKELSKRLPYIKYVHDFDDIVYDKNIQQHILFIIEDFFSETGLCLPSFDRSISKEDIIPLIDYKKKLSEIDEDFHSVILSSLEDNSDDETTIAASYRQLFGNEVELPTINDSSKEDDVSEKYSDDDDDDKDSVTEDDIRLRYLTEGTENDSDSDGFASDDELNLSKTRRTI